MMSPLVGEELAGLAGMSAASGTLNCVDIFLSTAAREKLRERRARLHVGSRPWSGTRARLYIEDFDGTTRIDFLEPGGRVSIGRCGRINATIACYRDVDVAIGDGTTINGARFSVMNSNVTLGRDCMLADEIVFQPNDQHAIFELEGLSQINTRSGITLGDHVWIGLRATLLAGARVGQGSIVGAASVVTGDVPDFSLVAGSPARVLRTGVSWSRSLSGPDVGTKLMQSRWQSA